jgi:ribosomal protein S18 acetylase RimI-like enzyme
MTAPAIVQATQADLDRLVDIFVRGFSDDPLYRWFTHPQRFDEVMARMFRADLGQSYLVDGICDLTPDSNGASAWRRPPGNQPESLFTRLSEVPELAAISGPARLPRIWQLMSRCAEEHPVEPHWYLSLLAVTPQQQRTGIGSALLAHALERVDTDHLPAYLENSKERNLEFYERHGFRTFKRLEFARGAARTSG